MNTESCLKYKKLKYTHNRIIGLLVKYIMSLIINNQSYGVRSQTYVDGLVCAILIYGDNECEEFNEYDLREIIQSDKSISSDIIPNYGLGTHPRSYAKLAEVKNSTQLHSYIDDFLNYESDAIKRYVHVSRYSFSTSTDDDDDKSYSVLWTFNDLDFIRGLRKGAELMNLLVEYDAILDTSNYTIVKSL